MTTHPVEETRAHTRLLKYGLETDDARAYWRRVDPNRPQAGVREVIDGQWFSARSMARVDVLLTNFRGRFDVFPHALRVLHAWHEMDPDARRRICHWHLQLSDPLYRKFTGQALVARRSSARPEASLPLAVAWLNEHGPARWSMSTRIQFASKLLTAVSSAGLAATDRDPRPLVCPRVDDHALSYILYLLREVAFQGNLLANPYLASVGLEGELLVARLRALSTVTLRRQGELVEFGWRYPNLLAWAGATVTIPPPAQLGAAG
ncbi:DUF1819 domain-containing protein [Nannocystis pusilla]|uniref:DUF1819 domain-containing protein n=1 Tax=Nannocystis pusilla TaxID=889268 RepID=UPI003BEFA31E